MKRYLTYNDIDSITKALATNIKESSWLPEFIVPIARGGTMPGLILSHIFDVPMCTVHWSTRDHSNRESNCWLPEYATEGRRILIVDDLSDTGLTFSQIKDDWNSAVVDEIKWGTTVKFAALQVRHSSNVIPEYYVEHLYNDDWQVYPWEQN